ncbi:hypothetical protein K4L06_14620 [Lysobacter sp. BMK333-48F3]|uniref:hypothetical protein n=1 Tax=Lysobacter sp. BMK333-48F3 TaxID=2867962 RepID=UPI001C8B14EE|nr:hypothetical protein [Lysobacter sp. BMK333-48F3]MBX9402541.1 hypothetical protein [Lysobacter sp. BMK333-48F3]
MSRLLSILLLTALAAACAPPRWAEPSCYGLPNTWELSEQELATRLGELDDEELLDLVACNMGTSHPPNIGFPERYVTDRPPTMATRLLDRIETRDEGFVSMSYIGLLGSMVEQAPEVLTASQRESALNKCLAVYPPYTNRRGEVHHFCAAFGGSQSAPPSTPADGAPENQCRPES